MSLQTRLAALITAIGADIKSLGAQISGYKDLAATFTQKTIALGSNSISGTMAQFNAACVDGDFAYPEPVTFTPVVRDAIAGNAATAGASRGLCTKIGNRAFGTVALTNIDTTGLTPGNQVVITGFPFVSRNLSNALSYFYVRASAIASTTGCINAGMPPNTSYVGIENAITTGATILPVSALTSGSADICFVFSFEV